MNYIIRQWNLWFNKKDCIIIIFDKNIFKPRDVVKTSRGQQYVYLGKNWFKKLNNMKVKSTKKRGERMFKCIKFKHIINDNIVKIKRPFSIHPIGDNWCFYLEDGKWSNKADEKGSRTSNYYAMEYDGYTDPYSLKAAKRLISKWNFPKGTKLKIGSPFVGYDFIITIK